MGFSALVHQANKIISDIPKRDKSPFSETGVKGISSNFQSVEKWLPLSVGI